MRDLYTQVSNRGLGKTDGTSILEAVLETSLLKSKREPNT